MERRVVVTGYGVVSPLGNDIDTFWNHIKDGKSGIKKLRTMNSKKLIRKLLGRIQGLSSGRLLWIKKNWGNMICLHSTLMQQQNKQ